MRYLGGGIGHASAQAKHAEDVAMCIDEDPSMANQEDGGAERPEVDPAVSGLAPVQAQHIQDTAMCVDGDYSTANQEEGVVECPELEPTDTHLLAELRRVASAMVDGTVVGGRDEVDPASDSEEEEDSDNNLYDFLSIDQEDDDDFGPEDGEDQGYVDTGYGGL